MRKKTFWLKIEWFMPASIFLFMVLLFVFGVVVEEFTARVYEANVGIPDEALVLQVYCSKNIDLSCVYPMKT